MRTLFVFFLLLSLSNSASAVIVAATLPASRSVQTGATASIFATVINAGSKTASNCHVTLANAMDANFHYQRTDPKTNTTIGDRNEPVDIAAGQAQSFILGITANSSISPTDVSFSFVCDDEESAPVISGLNTLYFSASDNPVPDIIALAATISGDGIVDLPTDNQFGFFSVATINLGSTATITVTTIATGAALSNTLICETDPVTAACKSDLLPEIDLIVTAGSTPTFSIFLSSEREVNFDPANNRVTVNFSESGVIRGSTSIAIRGAGENDDAAVTISPLPAIEDTQLTASTTWSEESRPLNYQWQRSGQPITGATSATYTPGDDDVGSVLSVVATYTDAQGVNKRLLSKASAPIININDTPAGTPTIMGLPTENQILTAETSTITDADGVGIFSYQWLHDLSAIPNATTSTYQLGDDDVGKMMTLKVSYTDNHGTLESRTSAPTEKVANVNDTPVGTLVITGTAQEDQLLSVDTSNLGDNDGLGNLSFQWKRNNVNIFGANNNTYLLGDDDVDSSINVVVSYTDDHGGVESVSSPAVLIDNINDAPIIHAPPENLAASVLQAFDFTPLYDDIDSTTSEGESLSLSVNQLPDWLAFYPSDGSVKGTPQTADLGPGAVSITVTDDEGLSDTITFTITVVDLQSITLTWDAPTTRVNGDPLPIEELDHYEVSYYRSGELPILASVTIAAPTFTTPALTPGTYYFQVRVIDSWGWESDYSDELSTATN